MRLRQCRALDAYSAQFQYAHLRSRKVCSGEMPGARARAGRVKECAWYVMYLQMAKSMTQRLNERVMVPIREGIEWRYN